MEGVETVDVSWLHHSQKGTYLQALAWAFGPPNLWQTTIFLAADPSRRSVTMWKRQRRNSPNQTKLHLRKKLRLRHRIPLFARTRSNRTLTTPALGLTKKVGMANRQPATEHLRRQIRFRRVHRNR